MRLSQICEAIEFELLQGSMDTEVSDIIYDSRNITDGTMFVCMVGAVTDGHKYIPDAIEKKASVIVLEQENEAKQIPEHITVIKVPSARRALALMSAAFFEYPAKKLTTIGLTGTKGKTTTTYMIKSGLEAAGKKVGLIGTIGALVGDTLLPTKNTTPESYELHKLFHAMVEAGCEYVVMEVASQAVKMDRVTGIFFDYGIFTNLSPDHIGPGEHESFEEYMACKSALFKNCRVGIVNQDDEHVDGILKGHTCEIKTFSTKKDADLTAINIDFLHEPGTIGMRFSTIGCVEVDAKIYIPGRFSVYNALVTMLTCHLCDVSDEDIVRGLELVAVKGRAEIVSVSKDFTVIVDYAHNEISTQSILKALLEYKPKRLICIFGAGGNRPKMRRYAMGEAAGALADLCVLTSDNPRFEEVKDINTDIKVGLDKVNGNYIEIDDRKEAIKYCLAHAQKGDMIVLLGKGHETYLEIKGVKYPYDERETIMQAKKELGI